MTEQRTSTSNKAPVSLALVGQSLIKRPLSGVQAPGFLRLVQLLRSADHAFTNFEGSIEGRFGGAVRKAQYYAVSQPEVLEDLREQGFDMLSLSNNHAYDFGPGGVLSTVDVATGLGFTFAGAGPDLRASAAPGVTEGNGPRIALLSFDCGPQPEEVYATNGSAESPAKPGINPLRMIRGDGELHVEVEDMERAKAAIRHARSRSDLVLVYLHSHHWKSPMWVTPPLMRAIARELIDTGATVVAAHGTPCMQGMEIFRESPIFYGLGNFIFHSWNPERWWGDVARRAWQSVAATCVWDGDGRLESIALTPVAVGHDSSSAELPFFDHPIVPGIEYGNEILAQFASMSRPLGTEIELGGDGIARVLVP